MNTVDDLRRTLERHSRTAPAAAGMVQRAQAGALRIRRRRRIATTVVAAAAALLVAVGVPVAASHHRTLPATPLPNRSASEMSIALATDDGFVPYQRVADGARQLIVAHAAGSRAVWGFDPEVWAYDPGAFDPRALPGGATIQVGGHDALLVPALSQGRLAGLPSPGGFSGRPLPSGYLEVTPDTAAAAAVVWQDPSGVWVTVSKTRDRAELLALAAAVRVDQPAPPLGPVGLTWLPPGLAVTHAETQEGFPGVTAKIELTVPRPDSNAVPAASAASQGPGISRVQIDVVEKSPTWTQGIKLGKSTLTIAGHPAWYVPATWRGPTQEQLMIETDTCGITVQTEDGSQVGRADLEKLMNEATYGSCRDETGWSPVVS